VDTRPAGPGDFSGGPATHHASGHFVVHLISCWEDQLEPGRAVIEQHARRDIDRIAAVTRPVVFAESKRARADFERTVLGTLKPDEGDTSQPRFDAEYAKLSFRPWPFPDQVEVDNLPLKAWIRGRHTNALDQLAGKVKAPRSRPRLF
jgi:hypothetical protein